MTPALLLRMIWSRRGLVALSTISAGIAASAAMTMLPVQYESKARVAIDLSMPDFVTGLPLPGNYTDIYLRSQIELVRDYRVMGRVVDQLGWVTAPELIERYNSQITNEQIPYRRWLSRFVSDSTFPAPVPDSNLLEITYTNPSPQAAQVIVGVIRDAYLAEAAATQQEEAAVSADFLRGRAEALANELAQASERKLAFDRKHGLIVDDGLDLERAELSQLMGRALAPAPRKTPRPLNVTAELNNLDAAIATQRATLGDQHPAVQALERQRSAVATFGSGSVTGSTSQAEAAIAAFRRQQAEVLRNADDIATARRLETDVMLLRQRYLATVQRLAELTQAASRTETRLQALGQPTMPGDPVFPNRPFIVIGSLTIGLLIGMMAAIIVETLSHRVRARDDVVEAGIPLLAVIRESRSRRLMARLRRLARRLVPGGRARAGAAATG